MAIKKENDMETMKKTMQDLISKRYKRPVWDQIKDAFGIFLLGLGLLLLLAVIVVLVITLIENSVSLAILCVTIFLIWMWSTR